MEVTHSLKNVVIKTVWYWNKDIYTNQYIKFITQEPRAHSGGRIHFNKYCWENRTSTYKRMKLDHLLYTNDFSWYFQFQFKTSQGTFYILPLFIYITAWSNCENFESFYPPYIYLFSCLKLIKSILELLNNTTVKKWNAFLSLSFYYYALTFNIKFVYILYYLLKAG